MQNLYTVVYKDQELVLDSNVVNYLNTMADFYSLGKRLVLSEEQTFQELLEINNNLEYYRSLLEPNYYTEFYGIKSYYDPQFISAYNTNEVTVENEVTFEINPFFNTDETVDLNKVVRDISSNFNQKFIEQYHIKNGIPTINKLVTSSLQTIKRQHLPIYEILSGFSDILVAGPKYVNNFLFGIRGNCIDFYCFSSNLKELRKTLCKYFSFYEDENKISLNNDIVVIYKTKFTNIEDIVNSFDLDCECCAMNVSSGEIYKNQRCIYSHKYKVNTINPEKISLLYYRTLAKYSNYGFSIVDSNKFVFPFDLNKFEKNSSILTVMMYNFRDFSEEDFSKDKIAKIHFPEALQELKNKGRIDFDSDLYNLLELEPNGTLYVNPLNCFNFEVEYLLEILNQNGIDISNILRNVEQGDSSIYYIRSVLDFLRIDKYLINNIHQALNLIYDYEYFDENVKNDDEEIEELKTRYYSIVKINNLLIKLERLFPLKNIKVTCKKVQRSLYKDQTFTQSEGITMDYETKFKLHYIECNKEIEIVKRLFTRLNIGFKVKVIFDDRYLSSEDKEDLKEHIDELQNCSIPYINLENYSVGSLQTAYRLIRERLVSL